MSDVFKKKKLFKSRKSVTRAVFYIQCHILIGNTQVWSTYASFTGGDCMVFGDLATNSGLCMDSESYDLNAGGYAATLNIVVMATRTATNWMCWAGCWVACNDLYRLNTIIVITWGQFRWQTAGSSALYGVIARPNHLCKYYLCRLSFHREYKTQLTEWKKINTTKSNRARPDPSGTHNVRIFNVDVVIENGWGLTTIVQRWL